MTIALWVLEYRVSRFPQDRAVSYHVFRCAHLPHCVEACRHEVEWMPRGQSKREALTLHQRGVNCQKGPQHG